MPRVFLTSATLIAMSLLISCGPAANTNTTNKPANAGNSTNTSNSNNAVNVAAIEADVKKLVTEAAASLSKNDVAAFEKMTTDNYLFISPDGRMSTRAERAAALRSGDSKYESVVYDDILVRANPHGTGAIATAVATVKGVNMGTKVDGKFRVTQVWRKTDDGWKMAHGHGTAITATAPSSNTAAGSNSAAQVDPKTDTNKQ